MQRYFVDKQDGELILTKEQIHQIKDVMRSKIGDSITLIFDKTAYLCEITSLQPFQIKVIDEDKSDNELRKDITLIYCLPKGDKLDYAIQKATELGVKRIVLCYSSRTVTKYKKEDEPKKKSRLQRIAIEASEQCRRNIYPEVCGVINFKDIKDYLSDINYIAYENTKGAFIKETDIKKATSVTILIGAEGGFSEEEVLYALNNSFKEISLGKRILRSETAVSYALSILSYLTEVIC